MKNHAPPSRALSLSTFSSQLNYPLSLLVSKSLQPHNSAHASDRLLFTLFKREKAGCSMEQEEQLDLEWVPATLDGIFEDAHADHPGLWQSFDPEMASVYAA